MSPLSRRRLFLIPTLALVCSLLGAGPASADCDQGLLACRMGHDTTTFEEINVRRIAATLYPRGDNEGLSLQVYRSLVPAAYEVPSPLVGVSFDYIDLPQTLSGAGLGASLPRVEATIALAVRLGEEDGWYPIARLTDSADAYAGGRDVGFPTAMAAATVSPAGNGLRGQVTVADAPAIDVEWQPASGFPSPQSTAWTQLHQPFFALSPVFQGPSRTRVKYTVKPPVPAYDWFREDTTPYGVSPSPEGVTRYGPQYRRSGMVRLTLDPDPNRFDADSPDPLPDLAFGEGRSLADLIVLDQTVVGTLWQTDELLVMQADHLDDGQSGPLPVDPQLVPSAGAAIVPPQGQLAGFLSPLTILSQGSSLMFGNLDLNDQHDLTHDVDIDRHHPATKPLFGSGYT
ncbi:MAG: acetoacetate decarboxylase family protein, partial [Actinomycetota bacterium]